MVRIEEVNNIQVEILLEPDNITISTMEDLS